MPSLQLYGEIPFYAIVTHETSLWMSCSFFFFSFPPSALMAEEVRAISGPLKVISCHLFCCTTIQPCLLLSSHVLCCLYFSIWPNDVVMGCLFNLTPLQTCGSRKTLSKLWKETRRTSARQATRAHPASYLWGAKVLSVDLTSMLLENVLLRSEQIRLASTGDAPPRRKVWFWMSCRIWVCNAVVLFLTHLRAIGVSHRYSYLQPRVKDPLALSVLMLII